MFQFAFYYDFITSLVYLARSFWRGFCNRSCSKVYGWVCNLTRCGKCCGKSWSYEIWVSENVPKVRGSLFLASILHHFLSWIKLKTSVLSFFYSGQKNEAWKGFASWHAVPLHTAKPCFMHRQVRFIKTPFQMKQLHFIPLWSIFRFASNMKHAAFAPYDKRNEKWELCGFGHALAKRHV